jgi:hypothetical protein
MWHDAAMSSMAEILTVLICEILRWIRLSVRSTGRSKPRTFFCGAGYSRLWVAPGAPRTITVKAVLGF